jgi:purine-binding chemotaxis protein CheW
MTESAVSRIVTFRLGADLFAADIQAVERVLRHDRPRALPSMPDWVEGVIEYSGRVVPVVDLRRRFGLAATPLTAQTRLIVLASSDEWVAALVDAVLDVRALPAAELTPSPAFFRGLAGEYLKGLTRRGDELVVVLDVDRLLASRESIALEAEPLASNA